MPWVNIFLLVLPFVVVRAHYNLISPQPYNRIDCNAPRCRGPCPPIWRSGRSRARNSPQRPAAVWRRGDVKEISWHRNNHEGGFVRMSLVPVKYMNNHLWHKKTAFAYSCFATNKYYCGKNKRCGTDQRGHAFRTWVRIPQILPDGDYVFSHTWAGGLHWRRRRAFFSDYYTCSFIRIRGGPVKQRYQPTFNAGRSRHRYVNRKGGVCASTSRYVGECGGMECLKNPVRYTKPGPFRGGGKPPPINRSLFTSNPNSYHAKDRDLVRSTLKEELDAIRSETWESQVDKRHAIQEAHQNAKEYAADLAEERRAAREAQRSGNV